MSTFATTHLNTKFAPILLDLDIDSHSLTQIGKYLDQYSRCEEGCWSGGTIGGTPPACWRGRTLAAIGGYTWCASASAVVRHKKAARFTKLVKLMLNICGIGSPHIWSQLFAQKFHFKCETNDCKTEARKWVPIGRHRDLWSFIGSWLCNIAPLITAPLSKPFAPQFAFPQIRHSMNVSRHRVQWVFYRNSDSRKAVSTDNMSKEFWKRSHVKRLERNDNNDIALTFNPIIKLKL